MTLAQIDAVPATTLKWALLLAFALLSAVGIAVGIWSAFAKRSIHIEPQPVEVRKSPKRYNHELITTQFQTVDHRLDKHDGQIQEIWTTMRAEDAAVRAEFNRCFKDIERALGRIEGKIDTKL